MFVKGPVFKPHNLSLTHTYTTSLSRTHGVLRLPFAIKTRVSKAENKCLLGLIKQQQTALLRQETNQCPLIQDHCPRLY